MSPWIQDKCLRTIYVVSTYHYDKHSEDMQTTNNYTDYISKMCKTADASSKDVGKRKNDVSIT